MENYRFTAFEKTGETLFDEVWNFANDDAAKSIALVMDALCGAVAEGLQERKIEKEKEKEASAEKEGDATVAKKLRSRKYAPAAEEKEN